MRAFSTTTPSQLVLSIVFSFLGLIIVDRAQAQQVVNPSFELPAASAAPNYIINPPTSAAVGWEFTQGTSTAFDNSGVQRNGSAFDGPATTDGQQTAFLDNHASISQSITFPATGEYQLTFKIAWGTDGASQDKIYVSLDGNALTSAEPASSSSFKTITIGFYASSGPHKLAFTGAGPGGPSLKSYALIDDVSIKPGPTIAFADSDHNLHPTSKIKLTGSDLGSHKGQFHIHFPQKSAVKFWRNGVHDPNGNDSDLYLNVDGAWKDHGSITSEKIRDASPIGKVDTQTVDITVITADGQTSNTLHATFHDDAVITSGPKKVTPNQSFVLKGWDFDSVTECQSHDRGTVTVHFPTKSVVKFQNQGSNASDDNLVIPVSSDGCLPDAVMVKVPKDTAGVVEQPVDVTYESPGGRKSNAWKPDFVPRIEMKVLPWQFVAAHCSNQGYEDYCNTPDGFAMCWNSINTQGVVGFWPPHVDSAIGYTAGCWGADSDNGTDEYDAWFVGYGANGKSVEKPTEGWMITGTSIQNPGVWINNADWLDNASAAFSYNTFFMVGPIPPAPGCVQVGMCFPARGIHFFVNWHIGATGGWIQYNADIYISGPVGTPHPQ